MRASEQLADTQAEDGVPEELETLVVGGAELVGKARMRERLVEPSDLGGALPIARVAGADDGEDARLHADACCGELCLLRGHVSRRRADPSLRPARDRGA